jgi:hypothetical protein
MSRRDTGLPASSALLPELPIASGIGPCSWGVDAERRQPTTTPQLCVPADRPELMARVARVWRRRAKAVVANLS